MSWTPATPLPRPCCHTCSVFSLKTVLPAPTPPCLPRPSAAQPYQSTLATSGTHEEEAEEEKDEKALLPWRTCGSITRTA